jgi:hypothetical protein
MTLPLYELVDGLYNTAKDICTSAGLPTENDHVNAAVFGATGTFVAIRSAQYVGACISETFYMKTLPKLEAFSMAVLTAGVAGFALSHPGEVKQMMEVNTVYLSGMASSGITAMITAGKDVYDKFNN